MKGRQLQLKALALSFWLCFAALCTLAQSAKVDERTIQLEKFEFKEGQCASRQGVEFLNNDWLILSAPLVPSCDKSNWNNGLPTQLTVIDLQGNVVAQKTRPDVYEIKPGPIGYVALCTETAAELVSSDLSTTRLLLTDSRKLGACLGIGGLSPSHKAIDVRDTDGSPKSPYRHRLFEPISGLPIAEHQFTKEERLAGITDSGYAVCNVGVQRDCVKMTVDGRGWAIGFPKWTFEHDSGTFLSASELLMPHFHTDKSLIAATPDGTQHQLISLKGFIPINVDNQRIQLSATYPRRLLYTATGCRIGDFDDCYGLEFSRFVVFDPQTHQALLKRDIGRDATSVISPNGHTVVTLEKTKLHIYTIP